MTNELYNLTWRITTILIVPIVFIVWLCGGIGIEWLAGVMVAAIATSKYIDYLERNDEHSSNG